MQDLNWNDLRPFLALCRTGQIAAAARILEINETTVSRRLKALEAQLGAPVLEKSSDGNHIPTALGEALLHHALRMERETQAIGALARQVSQRVRISAVPFMINQILVPRLPDLLGAYPDLSIDLAPEARNVDLKLRQADFALRFARPKTGGLNVHTRKLADLPFGLYARADPPEDIPLISYDEARAHLPQAHWQVSGPRAKVRVADIETAREAAAHGLGKVWLPLSIGQIDPRLARVPHPHVPTRAVWLLWHQDAVNAPVREWLENMDWTALQ